MRKVFLIIAALLLTFPVLAQNKSDILDIMKRQETHWNNADIDQFMEDYWKSPELKFIGKNGVTKGWQATKERYYKSYPDKAAMGTLTFTILEVDFLSKETAWVLGKYNLNRSEKGDLEGHFTLIFKKIDNKWLIVSDHSS